MKSVIYSNFILSRLFGLLKRKLIGDALFLFLDQLLKLAFGFIIVVFIARQFGPEYSGLFGYVLAISTLFTSLSGFGIDSIVVRDLLRPRINSLEYLRVAFWIRTLGGIISFLAAFLLFETLNIEYFRIRILIYLYVSISIFQGFDIVEFYCQSRTLNSILIKRKIVVYSISFIVKLLLIYFKFSIEWLIASYLFDKFLIAGLYYYMIRKMIDYHFDFSFSFNFRLVKNILLKSWPLMFSSFVIVIYMRIDQIMLKQYSSLAEVAYYSAALKLSEMWYIIPGVLSIVVYPELIKAKQRGRDVFNELILISYSSFLWIAIIISVIMLKFSTIIITLVYGEAFSPSVEILNIHIWTTVFVFLGVLSSNYFIIENLQVYSFYRTFAGACVNIILNFILIPIYGGIGAAYATLFSQLVASYLFNIFSTKTRMNFYLQSKSLTYPFYKFLKL